jgi:hypothetical protein
MRDYQVSVKGFHVQSCSEEGVRQLQRPANMYCVSWNITIAIGALKLSVFINEQQNGQNEPVCPTLFTGGWHKNACNQYFNSVLFI